MNLLTYPLRNYQHRKRRIHFGLFSLSNAQLHTFFFSHCSSNYLAFAFSSTGRKIGNQECAQDDDLYLTVLLESLLQYVCSLPKVSHHLFFLLLLVDETYGHNISFSMFFFPGFCRGSQSIRRMMNVDVVLWSAEFWLLQLLTIQKSVQYPSIFLHSFRHTACMLLYQNHIEYLPWQCSLKELTTEAMFLSFLVVYLELQNM